MHGEKLNLGLTSADREVVKELRKRVAEAGMLGKYYAIQVLDLKVSGHGISRGYIDISLCTLMFCCLSCRMQYFRIGERVGQESLIDSFISDGMMR